MKLVRNTFFVTADNTGGRKFTKIIGLNGTPLFLDTDFNKHKHAQNVATIYSTPLSVETDYNGVNLYENKLNVGDTVIVHHHVCQPNKVVKDGDNKVFRCDYFNIMAKIENDDIIPLEQFLFIEPIVEPPKKSAGGLLLTFHDTTTQGSGYVYRASIQAQQAGVRNGDKVYYTKSADYSIEVLGLKFYRMRIRNIIAIERDGELYCMDNKVLIMEIPKGKAKLIGMPESSEKDGVVVRTGVNTKGIVAGDKVNFCYSVSEKINWNNGLYGAIETKHINYKVA